MFMSVAAMVVNFIGFANTRSGVFAVACLISVVSSLAIVFGFGVSEIGEKRWANFICPVTCIGGLVVSCLQMDMLSTQMHRLVLLQMAVLAVYSLIVAINSLKGAKAE